MALNRVVDVSVEYFVEERLVVAAAGTFDLVTEPVEDFRIETNGDASLAARSRDNRAAFSTARIIFTPSQVL